MAIHKVESGYVISSGGTWRTGVYDSLRAARYAFRFPDATLAQLQKSANQRAGGTGGVITMADLQEARRQSNPLTPVESRS